MHARFYTIVVHDSTFSFDTFGARIRHLHFLHVSAPHLEPERGHKTFRPTARSLHISTAGSHGLPFWIYRCFLAVRPFSHIAIRCLVVGHSTILNCLPPPPPAVRARPLLPFSSSDRYTCQNVPCGRLQEHTTAFCVSLLILFDERKTLFPATDAYACLDGRRFAHFYRHWTLDRYTNGYSPILLFVELSCCVSAFARFVRHLHSPRQRAFLLRRSNLSVFPGCFD